MDVICRRAVPNSDELELVQESNPFRMDPDRLLALEYVKALNISCLSRCYIQPRRE